MTTEIRSLKNDKGNVVRITITERDGTQLLFREYQFYGEMTEEELNQATSFQMGDDACSLLSDVQETTDRAMIIKWTNLAKRLIWEGQRLLHDDEWRHDHFPTVNSFIC